MPKILPIDSEVARYLDKRGLRKKFQRQINYLSSDIRHPSLRVERLNPKEKGIYSFRVDQKYRGIFVFLKEINAIEILDVSDHYK